MVCLRLRFIAVAAFVATAAILLAASPRKRPSIVLVSVDTLRADHLSSYGYARRTSPNIDAVAARGLVFDRAIVPQPQTSPSHASLLTGVSPWKHGVLSNGFMITRGVDTLAAALRRVGYETAGVVAVAHLGSSRGFAYGFNRFAEPPALTRPEVVAEHRRNADWINAEAKRAIDAHRAGAPMFLFVHYFDCHYPYHSWEGMDLARAFAPEEMRQTAKQIRRYDDGIEYVDRHIGELLAYVKKKLGDNVVVVITADHGEQIGDHGLLVGHSDIYRETVHVPLIMAGPDIDAKRIRTRVTNMDVPVSLARLGGATLRNVVDGTDLLDVAAAESSFRRLFRNPEERTFVVTGTPTYTRSVLLIKDSSWFIKNFDNAYRYARTVTPSDRHPAKPLKGHVVEREMTYTVDIRRFRPYWVTFEHVAKSADCAATAMTSIEPGFFYYRQPTPFKGSIRVTVPAARMDAVSLAIAPATCAGKTTYEVTREAPPGTNGTPDLFQNLVARRMRSGDELYDSTVDPLMSRNLLTLSGSPFEGELRTLFERSVLRTPPQKVPPEQIRALRSLGYL